MAEEEKKNNPEETKDEAKEKAEETAETNEGAEKKEEKKDNAFSRFWKKTKQSVNDAVLESKIHSAYQKAHANFSVYEKDALLSTGVSGEITDGVLTVFGKVEVDPWSVVIADDKEETAYYIVSSSKTTVKSMVEGVEYEREGTAFVLDPNVEEIPVVKAGKRYFRYKGETTSK